MTRIVHCKKLNKEAEGMAFQTWPGELGKKVYENISQEAWNMWLNHQTMLINEYRLNPMEPAAKKMVTEELEKFLFGDGVEKPEGYVAPE